MSVRAMFAASVFTVLTVLVPGIAKADHYDRGYRDYDNRLICESHEGRTRYCPADIRGGARLVYQRSRSACIEGRSWGWDRRGVWVSRGCRAEFVVFGRAYGRDRDWDDRYDRDRYGDGYDDRYEDRYDRDGYGGLVRCESHDGRYNTCRIGRGFRGVSLERQLSKAHCQQGYSWGSGRDGIWVDRGCRAEFRVY